MASSGTSGLDVGDEVIINSTLYNNTDADIPLVFNIQRQELILRDDRLYSVGVNRFKIPTDKIKPLLNGALEQRHIAERAAKGKLPRFGQSAFSTEFEIYGVRLIQQCFTSDEFPVNSITDLVEMLNRSIYRHYSRYMKNNFWLVKMAENISLPNQATGALLLTQDPNSALRQYGWLMFHTGTYVDSPPYDIFTKDRRKNYRLEQSIFDFTPSKRVFVPQYFLFGTPQFQDIAPADTINMKINIYMQVYDGGDDFINGNIPDGAPGDGSIIATYPLVLGMSLKTFQDQDVAFSDEFPLRYNPNKINESGQYAPEVPFVTYGQHVTLAHDSLVGKKPFMRMVITCANRISDTNYEVMALPLIAAEFTCRACDLGSHESTPYIPFLPSLPPMFQFNPATVSIDTVYSPEMYHLGLMFSVSQALAEILNVYTEKSQYDTGNRVLVYPYSVDVPPWDNQLTRSFPKLSSGPGPGPGPTPTPILNDWEKIVIETSLPVRREIQGETTEQTNTVLTDFQIDGVPADYMFQYSSLNVIPPRIYRVTQASMTLNSFSLTIFLERAGGHQEIVMLGPGKTANIILAFIPQTI